MDKERRSELKRQYLEAKPEMGILVFHCIPNGHLYLKAVSDTRGRINSFKQRLDAVMYNGSRNRQIQEDWKRYGEDGFRIEIGEILSWDDSLSDREREEELAMLLEEWMTRWPEAKIME